ncbi:hypothetical protein CEUSTIGMA_g635.t1 [Chlamydomonas eustigma]|uniref:KANL3/Tex30 alpha/beta hydrolase-like domain-containing protein n=1 Tax=Chlamydomonas eustigma TaxID=1157962 RepID=A0A250WR86_9CHLO|nr:hypothetical protein CEUSTIGMA_g635.t1 [Chlamydomonas eustigma]|eukprot:GAX73182.1 hypothetical protein CEUSTIGMA_g635.t1 [Chlamydomonas eustigma]
MVRFHWHVEDGFGAFIPPGAMLNHKSSTVQHALVEIEISGQTQNVEALITVPPGYLQDSEIKDVGIILAHGNDADDWRSKLLTELAVSLSNAGHIVMRYHCAQKEQRRQRIFEKTLDACATSPFARMCSRWVLAGIGSGARVAAAVGTRCRGTMAGFVLISYPLMEPMPNSKGASMETSMQPLTKLSAPLLFVQPGHDPLCNASLIRENVDRMPAPDIRMLELPDADASLRTVLLGGATTPGPQALVTKRVCDATLQFVEALNNSKLESCKLLQLKGDNVISDLDSSHIPPPDASLRSQLQQQQPHFPSVLQTTQDRLHSAPFASSSAPQPTSISATVGGPAPSQLPASANQISAAFLPALQGLLQSGNGGAAANLAAALGLGGQSGGGGAPGLQPNFSQQQLMAAMIAAAGKRSAPEPESVTGVMEEPQAKRIHIEGGPLENQQTDNALN